jgi:DNA-directed RNA polymerase specialized sigma24 family protein
VTSSSGSDRRRGDRRAGGGGRGGATGGAAKGGVAKGGAAKSGSRKGKGGARPARRPTAPGENETVQQLTGPLQKVLARLPETQRRVLELRMGLADGHPHDLADTARELGLSLSEARDIEQRAFGYIREAVPLQQLQRFLPKS